MRPSSTLSTAAATSRRTEPRPASGRPAWPLVLADFAGMVLAMLAGMVLLAPLWPLHPTRFEPRVLLMATDMVLGMTAYMAARRHPWHHVRVMGALMYLPFVAVLPAYWAGWVAPGALLDVAHVLMLVAMAVATVLLHRPGRVTRQAAGRSVGDRPAAGRTDERLAGLLGVVGIALEVPLGYLHPHHAQPNDSAAAFGEYARDPSWVLVHLGQFAGALLVATGLVLLSVRLGRQDGLAGALGPVAATAAAVSAAVFAVQMAVDGVALKSVVDAWAAAGAPRTGSLVQVADAVRSTEKGLDALFQLTTGAALLALGLSQALGRWPRWLPALALLSGAGLLAAGVATALGGFSPLAGTLALLPSVTLPAFLLGVAGWTWRRVPTP